MTKVVWLSIGLLAICPPAFAQSGAASGLVRPQASPSSNSEGTRTDGMSEGRAGAADKSGPVGETAPNGNVRAKEKSGANGS